MILYILKWALALMGLTLDNDRRLLMNGGRIFPGRALKIFLVSVMGWMICAYEPNAFAQEAKYYYFSDGRLFHLELSTNRIALRLRANQRAYFSANTSTILKGSAYRDLESENITIFNYKHPVSKDDVEALMQTLQADSAVELVPLTFKKGSTEMIVTDEFIAQFVPGLNEDAIQGLISPHQVEIKKVLDKSSNTYILKTSGGNALKKSNEFHLMGKDKVIYAHPNFLRIMYDPSRMDPDETLVWGPTGERYYGDVKALKGTNIYRSVGPSQAVLPASISSSIGPNMDVLKNSIKEETFEGVFPNTWARYGDPTWASTTYRKYAGSYAGYCVGSSVAAPGNYPNNASSWMVYGPFSLADVTKDAYGDARVNLQAWVNTEANYDHLRIYASIDGANFYGSGWSGNWAGFVGGTGWMNIGFDLKNVYTLGDLRGQSQVWIAIVFSSDIIYTYEGVYVDNVVIEKIAGGYTDLTSDVYDHLQWSLNNTRQLWGTSGADIDAVNGWGVSQGNSDAVIAIIDEGIDLTHPDLASKLVAGYDATGSGGAGGPSGDDAHGTNCAGIAGAITGNSTGVAGIARLARIMPVRIGMGDGSGGWLTSDAWIADGINWAVSHGADVLSNSWGGGDPATVITTAIQNAKTSGRGGKGCLVVFSSGNNNGPVTYPATLAEVLAVGALSPCDERKAPTSCDGEYWWGSNYGSELDISAPGVHMYSTDIQGSAGYSTTDYFYNFNGTSSACPVVAGVAGLLIGKCPQLRASEAEQILKSTADDLGSSGRDDVFGYGRINAYKALMQNCGSSGAIIFPVRNQTGKNSIIIMD